MRGDVERLLTATEGVVRGEVLKGSHTLAISEGDLQREIEAGRWSATCARNHALSARAALGAGDDRQAAIYLRLAQKAWIEALSRVQHAGKSKRLRALPVGAGGRPDGGVGYLPSVLWEATQAGLAAGMKLTPALFDAVNRVPELRTHYRTHSPQGLRNAYHRARRKVQPQTP